MEQFGSKLAPSGSPMGPPVVTVICHLIFHGFLKWDIPRDTPLDSGIALEIPSAIRQGFLELVFRS
jgi:hypothetical protein